MPKRIVMIVVILPDLLTNGVGLVFLARYAEIIKRTTRREFAPMVTNTKLMYNPYLIAMGTVAWDMINPEMIMIGTKNGLSGKNSKIRSEFLESFYNVV